MNGWPKLDSGEMIHRVTLLQESIASDISGTTTVWSPFATVWAKVDPVRGTEVIKAGQDTTQLFLTVKIWWMRGVLANMRLSTEQGTYLIQSVENPGERNVVLILNCIALGGNDR